MKAQYAGGMGVVSVGAGWDYGRKQRWETDIMVGILPRRYSDNTHLTFTLRQNYIPWSIRCCDRFCIEPFTAGIYLSAISGERFWVKEPARYGGRYYKFTSRLRSFIYVGERLTWYTPNNPLLRAITLYYELSASDMAIISKVTNRTLHFDDIFYFSFGVKFQLFKR